jgi:hypothetical protein
MYTDLTTGKEMWDTLEVEFKVFDAESKFYHEAVL